MILENLYIIVGLGNPGRKYTYTKHNMGFQVADKLAREYGIKIKKLKFKSLFGEGQVGGCRSILVKPQTYMNASGESVRDIVEWYKIPLSNLIVVYDDADIALGTVRIRKSGSSGTHNGMKSVIYQLNSDEFTRVRLGIGSPEDGTDIADYVLRGFIPDDFPKVAAMIETASKAVVDIIQNGANHAMNMYNGAANGRE
jgi:PTH1 family peptidyl-tRNA hydrolase